MILKFGGKLKVPPDLAFFLFLQKEIKNKIQKKTLEDANSN